MVKLDDRELSRGLDETIRIGLAFVGLMGDGSDEITYYRKPSMFIAQWR